LNATIRQAGEYIVTVGVRDTRGEKNEQEVRFIVEND